MSKTRTESIQRTSDSSFHTGVHDVANHSTLRLVIDLLHQSAHQVLTQRKYCCPSERSPGMSCNEYETQF